MILSDFIDFSMFLVISAVFLLISEFFHDFSTFMSFLGKRLRKGGPEGGDIAKVL